MIGRGWGSFLILKNSLQIHVDQMEVLVMNFQKSLNIFSQKRGGGFKDRFD